MSLLRARDQSLILVQEFNSIHDIDPEFIANIEVLLQEEAPGFKSLVFNHDKAPSTDLFTYFLFFAPTQNTPIGIAQLTLRKVPSENLRSFGEKLKFWEKEHEHWKQLTWKVGDGSFGFSVFDPRFARSGKEKLLEIMKEYEQRKEIVALEYFALKGLQEVKSTLPAKNSQEIFILDSLPKSHKTYQDYLSGLSKEAQSLIKQNWKTLHQQGEVKLGDYLPTGTPHTLPIPEDQLKAWEDWGASVLTFEKDLKILGCLVVMMGKNGNAFFEPFPFEPMDTALVPDELYTQYALLKFYEMPEARRCHLLKNGSRFQFMNRDDAHFFEDQGFQLKTLVRSFSSKLIGLDQAI